MALARADPDPNSCGHCQVAASKNGGANCRSGEHESTPTLPAPSHLPAGLEPHARNHSPHNKTPTATHKAAPTGTVA